ncbi:hypothetical protein CEXT_245041 [Caerostris extrusa]|uniref:Uncharacterized protein n=1 Tax=Caerostris extrusa TaxID=172846 RepID=A0AAV4V359_CAEEX|nr:hypothetical protein CEXT_245041 [Caerostris extrusa]
MLTKALQHVIGKILLFKERAWHDINGHTMPIERRPLNRTIVNSASQFNEAPHSIPFVDRQHLIASTRNCKVNFPRAREINEHPDRWEINLFDKMEYTPDLSRGHQDSREPC